MSEKGEHNVKVTGGFEFGDFKKYLSVVQALIFVFIPPVPGQVKAPVQVKYDYFDDLMMYDSIAYRYAYRYQGASINMLYFAIINDLKRRLRYQIREKDLCG